MSCNEREQEVKTSRKIAINEVYKKERKRDEIEKMFTRTHTQSKRFALYTNKDDDATSLEINKGCMKDPFCYFAHPAYILMTRTQQVRIYTRVST